MASNTLLSPPLLNRRQILYLVASCSVLTMATTYSECRCSRTDFQFARTISYKVVIFSRATHFNPYREGSIGRCVRAVLARI